MKKAIALLTLILVLAVPAVAGAVELVRPDGTVAEPFQTWADRARVPLPDMTIKVAYDTSACEVDAYECAFGGDTIGMHPACVRAKSIRLRRVCRFSFWHGLGHFVAWNLPSEQVGRTTLIVGTAWDYQDGLSGGNYTQEIFADSYALCQFRLTDPLSVWIVGERHHHRRICKMLLAA